MVKTERVKQLVKQLKFEGYTEEQILKMVKECLPLQFDYSK
jgi:hypothetical protein